MMKTIGSKSFAGRRDPRIDPQKGDVVDKPGVARSGVMRIVVVARTEFTVTIRKITRRNTITRPVYRWREFAGNGSVVKVASPRTKARAA